MKLTLCLSVLVSVLWISGCGTLPGGGLTHVQQLLDASLPPDFRGDALLKHTNPYVKGSIRAGDLHRTPTGWSYSWLVYERDGWGTRGEIRLGKPPEGT